MKKYLVLIFEIKKLEKSNFQKLFENFCRPFNPILPGLWKDVVTRGGHYGPPLFFWLWGYLKPKTEPWYIFGTKNYLKSHIEHF